MNLDKVLELLRALEREQVEYILVGGVAVNLQGFTRTTQDVDIFIRIERENVERLKRAFHAVWDDPSIEEIRFEELAGDYPAICYGPPDEAFSVDILGRLGTAWEYKDLEAETRNWEGVNVRVATAKTLVRMKKDTVRDIDKLDVAELRERYGLQE